MSIRLDYNHQRTADYNSEYSNRFGCCVAMRKDGGNSNNPCHKTIEVDFLRYELDRQGAFQLATEHCMRFDARFLSGSSGGHVLTTTSSKQYRHTVFCQCGVPQCQWNINIDVIHLEQAKPLLIDKKAVGDVNGRLVFWANKEHGYVFWSPRSFVLRVANEHHTNWLPECQSYDRYRLLNDPELERRARKLSMPVTLPIQPPHPPADGRYRADEDAVDAHQLQQLAEHAQQLADAISNLSTVQQQLQHTLTRITQRHQQRAGLQLEEEQPEEKEEKEEKEAQDDNVHALEEEEDAAADNDGYEHLVLRSPQLGLAFSPVGFGEELG